LNGQYAWMATGIGGQKLIACAFETSPLARLKTKSPKQMKRF